MDFEKTMECIVGVVVKDAATSAQALGFDSRAGKPNRHSVANDTPPLWCFFGAVLPSRDDELRLSTHSSPYKQILSNIHNQNQIPNVQYTCSEESS